MYAVIMRGSAPAMRRVYSFLEDRNSYAQCSHQRDEYFDAALRRFKRACEKAGVLTELRPSRVSMRSPHKSVSARKRQP